MAEPEAPVRYYAGTTIETDEYLSYAAVKQGLPPNDYDEEFCPESELSEKDKEWLADFRERKAAAKAAHTLAVEKRL